MLLATTFEIARAELRRQSIAAGFGGRLDDVAVALTENGAKVVVFAHYTSDYSPRVCVDLTEPQAASFDAAAVIRFFEASVIVN